MASYTELLKKGASKLGIELTDDKLFQFHVYTELLLEHNKKVNLTAITDKNEIILKHFIDSLTLLCSEKAAYGASLIDVGAGAGFPSLPLKIARPDLKITMLDSLSKRVDFLNGVIYELGLKDASAVHARAEDAARGKLREGFDIAAARAVANLSVLAEYAIPFVKPGGFFIAMKGGSPYDEIDDAAAAIRTMGGIVDDVKIIEIPESGIKHSLVVIKKTQRTPSKYPRKAGKPAKEPVK